MSVIDTPAVSLRSRAIYDVMRMLSRVRLAEPELLGLSAVIRPGDHVFDVGAAYGMYTFPLAHLVGADGSVHAFEPQPRQHQIMRALSRLMGVGHINITRSVLGAAQGEHLMLLPLRFGVPIHGHAHIADGTEHALTKQSARTRRLLTPMVTIDSWCELHNVENVSFIKVDVEGFEPDVLIGAIRTITRYQPSLLLEIEDRHTGRYGRGANQFAEEVLDSWPDYSMYRWSGGSWTPTDRVRASSRNYLFATDEAFQRAEVVDRHQHANFRPSTL
ncbi:FkbM family methyltransferase [Arthrobacter sp. H41]|uniref:FkbM family methyltransferase n=1 Tax=Arthrobacter sp. H41 TaxID=1312978 RepID=UPI0004B7A28E|nr:FkbM family methyltransferase [Arthrobacter sp. H41]